MGDVTRSSYRELLPVEKENIARIKAAGEAMLAELTPVGKDSRELAIARTKVEKAVMWAVKGITG